MGMKVKTKVKINTKSKTLGVKELASSIMQATLEMNRKLRRREFEEPEEEQKQETTK